MNAAKHTATLAVADAALTLSTVGAGTVGVQLVDGGSFSGTVTFEATLNGVDWVAINGTPLASVTGVSTATAGGIWQFPVAGMNQFRARLSTATAGSIIVNAETAAAAITKY